MILCFIGIHKYIDDTRPILQTDGKKLSVGNLPVTWCKHCHKPKDIKKEIIRTSLASLSPTTPTVNA